MQLFTKDYLEHHGIIGQKWGVRRYQNKDGSLTDLGKRRVGNLSDADRMGGIHKELAQDYGNMSGALKNASKVANSSSEAAGRAGNIKRRRAKNQIDLSEMSDKELRDHINRMNLERQFTDLSTLNSTTGYDYVQDILSIGGSALAATGSVLGIMLAIQQIKSKT